MSIVPRATAVEYPQAGSQPSLRWAETRADGRVAHYEDHVRSFAARR